MPIRELPNLLCALGEAPTQLELNNVFSECRGIHGVMHRQAAACESKADQRKAFTCGRIAFERFFELYLNQRAVQPFQYADVVDAFKVLSKGAEDSELKPETLTKLLCTVRLLKASALPNYSHFDTKIEAVLFELGSCTRTCRREKP